jgi:uncharacterized protein (TIGR00730 family)
MARISLNLKDWKMEKLDLAIESIKKGLTILDEISGGDGSIAVFGSARTEENSTVYKEGYALGKWATEAGIHIITGGGPGVMEAVNRGAFENKGEGLSIGCGVLLPMENKSNQYLDKVHVFEHFFSRKIILMRDVDAYIFMEGGVGTMDELFEVLTLMQTEIIEKRPIYIIGELHDNSINFILAKLFNKMESLGTISHSDQDLFLFVETVSEMVECFQKDLTYSP